MRRPSPRARRSYARLIRITAVLLSSGRARQLQWNAGVAGGAFGIRSAARNQQHIAGRLQRHGLCDAPENLLFEESVAR
jgi:hypothetical protein